MGGCCQSETESAANSPSFQNGEAHLSKEALVIWEYLEDISSVNWVPYDNNISQQINVAYTSSARKCQISKQSNGQSFEIDFNLMIETNVVNGWQRKVRMRSPPKQGLQGHQVHQVHQGHKGHQGQHGHHGHHVHQPHKSPNMRQKHDEIPQKSMSSHVQFVNANDVNPNPLLLQQEEDKRRKEYNTRSKWQWFSESIGWKDYDDKLSNKIDEAYTQNIARYAFKIRSNNTKYEIDFDRMKQCNLDTMKLRVIRRVARSASSAPSASSVSMDDMAIDQENGRFVWEYYDDDDGEWHEYGDNVSLKIETVHHSNAAVARMKIHGTEYEIRLNEMPMNQYNLKTGKISPIKRMIKSRHRKRESNMRNNIIHTSNCKYQWRYKEGANTWHVYPPDINLKIEKAFRSELDRYSFTMNNEQYEIQFNYLRQIKLETNETNEIARIDNTNQKRSHTLFNMTPIVNGHGHANAKRHHEPAKSFNPSHNKPIQKHNKQKHNKRSATLDMDGASASDMKANDFDFLIKQQQKAMKYFKSQQHKKNSSHETDDNEDLKWQFRDDDGVWLDYPPSVSLQIERAFEAGESSIDITQDGIVFEIRIQHSLECNFATNKMRAIRRMKYNNNDHHNIDLEDQFDALSNKLDLFVKEEHSDTGEQHDDDEKDNEYKDSTPQMMNEESYDEQGSQATVDNDIPEAATPADSEFALKDYGNDYNDYIQKFNTLNQGYFD